MDLISRLFGSNSLKQLNPSELNQMSGKVYILDVRQPEEFRGGHIAGAKLIPLDQLEGRMKDLPRNREIVCVCQSGSRSGSASRQLVKAGYQVANLRGGMSAWGRAGLPVKKGSN